MAVTTNAAFIMNKGKANAIGNSGTIRTLESIMSEIVETV
jgi:hypothetical protein